jgi:hypothetical protein
VTAATHGHGRAAHRPENHANAWTEGAVELLVLRLECHCDTLATADAQRRESPLSVAPTHFMQEGDEHPAAGRADRMTRSHRAFLFESGLEACQLRDASARSGRE